MARMDPQQVRACYYAYLSRPGPSNLGTVEWPNAKPGCLRGMKFLTTGILETIAREDAVQLLTDCGGHVMSGMSKNLSYLIVGRDAGPVKLEKAEEWGVQQLSEEEFFTFITDKINNYDPSMDNREEEKPKKPAPKKAAPKKPAAAPKKETKPSTKQEKKPLTEKVVPKKKAEAEKVKVERKPGRKTRGRAGIEVDMEEINQISDIKEEGSGDVEGDVTKRAKKGVNGKTSKKRKADTDAAEPAIKTEMGDVVKDEPTSEGEEQAPPVVKKIAKEKVVKKSSVVKKDPEDKEKIGQKRGRGRPKK